MSSSYEDTIKLLESNYENEEINNKRIELIQTDNKIYKSESNDNSDLEENNNELSDNNELPDNIEIEDGDVKKMILI